VLLVTVTRVCKGIWGFEAWNLELFALLRLLRHGATAEGHLAAPASKQDRWNTCAWSHNLTLRLRLSLSSCFSLV